MPWRQDRMRVSVEQCGPITILRCSGTHACTDEDHANDCELSTRLADGLRDGDGRFILDVRDLDVVYPSGMADIFNPWLPAVTGPNAANAARVVILWKPVQGHRKGWRWAQSKRYLARALQFVTEEREALALLTSSEPRAAEAKASDKIQP